MKYVEEITINTTLDKVIEIFEDEKQLKHWQRGLLKSRLIKGKAGEVGSVRKLKIDLDLSTVSMREEMIYKNLPYEWFAEYRSAGLVSIQKNYFQQVEGSTLWKSKSEFKFSGYMKMISKLLPSIFKERSKIIMKDFKDYIENGNSASLK
ncbi:SRPBCC family protein [Psychroflexus sp. ALD_RP9]|uniref:SRPBCC family protein n=1 Tax=Psychroflexus sp. ALD_RP9 TaxID=2777186 RepID=UPI001A8FD405|nr:SRPBCC family protein [Psychroflexus sp. ALD_RP9]QSS97582.1 SRPBCC family protein [Psychroflexus sp. ALD_RP9]